MDNNKEIKRILVALDASVHSKDALRVAAQLAYRLNAELQGLFVEDEEWFKAGAFDKVRVIGEYTGSVRSVSRVTLEIETKAMASRIRQMLYEVSSELEVRHTFRVVRGEVDAAILSASEQVDLITVGRTGHSFGKSRKLGRTARAILENATKPVLLLQAGLRLGNSVFCIYDGPGDSARTIRLAARIAGLHDTALEIVAASEGKQPEVLRREVEKLIPAGYLDKSNILLHTLSHSDIWRLATIVKQRQGGLLIASRRTRMFQNTELEKLMDSINCPLLLL